MPAGQRFLRKVRANVKKQIRQQNSWRWTAPVRRAAASLAAPVLLLSLASTALRAQSTPGAETSATQGTQTSASATPAASSAATTSPQNTQPPTQSATIDLQSAARSAADPYSGSIVEGHATDEVLQLSLDDAIARGIRTNYALTNVRAQERAAQAQTLEALDPLLPVIKAQGSTGVYQFNLATEGFTPALLPELTSILGGAALTPAQLIVRVDVTRAEATYDQTLFSLENWTRYKSAKVEARAAYYNTQSSRGLVVLNVGDAYLQALAYAAQIDAQTATLRADEVMLKQVVAEHEAGTVARIDELRARVQYQQQQQQVIAAQNQYDKSLIALKRRIGLPIDQKIQLTDASPYSDLDTLSPDQARLQAYQNRQDYQSMQQQLEAARLNLKAAHYERFPTLSFDGDYGITGQTHGLYHGTFDAVGTLSIPIFKEARFRGDTRVASTTLNQLTQRFNNLKEQIDQQLRDSLLDVQTAVELVKVARSNVELATKELEQSNDQFSAGTTDNLPVVQSQATLASAQTQLVQDTLQFNEAKLGLARNLGIVDTQYKTFLHGK